MEGQFGGANGRHWILPAAPESTRMPQNGDTWYNTSNNTMNTLISGAWEKVFPDLDARRIAEKNYLVNLANNTNAAMGADRAPQRGFELR